ncbi:MAG: ABC transporter permease [Vulcanisaeta sp. AZ3]|jgi:peptide/nickel transport system permease protein
MARRKSEFRILGMTPGEIAREFISSSVGKVALVLFIVLIVFSIYALIVLPSNFGSVWNNPNYWQLNPEYAPPAWVDSLIGPVYSPQVYVDNYQYTVQRSDGTTYITVSFSVDYRYDHPWSEIFIVINNPSIYGLSQPPLLSIIVTRPDGSELTLGPLPISSETTLLGAAPQVVSQVNLFYAEKYHIISVVPSGQPATPYLFYTVDDGRLTPLKGVYNFRLVFYVFSGNGTSIINKDDLKVVLQGQVYGLMGTDNEGHDLWLGLLAGFPIDLAIGLLTALIAVIIAVVIGIVAGFYGGLADEGLMRLTDFTILLPAFPLLIVFSVLFRWSIWDAIIFLAILSWGGSARIIRAMVMQIRSAQYIESAMIAGASRMWILRNHILPQIIPYILYLLVTGVPGGILTITSINFLGLAGSEYPTWGMLLYYADVFGALTSGYWWWVIPPGLLVAYTAVVFILAAMASEPVVNPRLRYG